MQAKDASMKEKHRAFSYSTSKAGLQLFSEREFHTALVRFRSGIPPVHTCLVTSSKRLYWAIVRPELSGIHFGVDHAFIRTYTMEEHSPPSPRTSTSSGADEDTEDTKHGYTPGTGTGKIQ